MLIDEIQNVYDQLSASVKSLRRTLEASAQAEKDYKMLLSKEALKMRDEGMAVGMISLTIHGIPSVAEARFKRDIAEGVYKANLEAINVYKLQLKLMEAQANREWSVAE